MKNLIYSIFALLLFAGACKKNDESNAGSINTAENLLTDPATGWKRVAVVPFDGLGGPRAAMQGFDLQKVGNQFAALYTQHSRESYTASSSDYFYKALVVENGTAEPERVAFGIFTGPGMSSPFTYYGQFVPGTSTPVFTGMDYTNNYIELRNNKGEAIAGAPASNYPTFRYAPDGEFIAGSVWTGHESFLWHYKNPPDPIGDFGYTYRAGIIDGNKRLFNIPFKGADGSYYELSLCSKNNAVTFITLRCREDRTYGAIPPNYEIVDSAAVAGLPQAGFFPHNLQLLTYDYNSAAGEITFVFNDYPPTSAGESRLYGYRWKQGSLTRLWETSLDADMDLKAALQVYVNKNMLNEWRLKPDGTLYLAGAVSSISNPRSEDPALKLWEVNGSGIRTVATLTVGQTAQKEFIISTFRYIDGAYYALAYPTGDNRYQAGDPHFHMEIVKLNQ
jgi:hypothetical protein